MLGIIDTVVLDVKMMGLGGGGEIVSAISNVANVSGGY